MFLERYFELSEGLGLDPDTELVGPIIEKFQQLASEGGDHEQ